MSYMDNKSNQEGLLRDSAAVALTGKIMMVAVILLFMLVVAVFLLHLYAKWCYPSRGGQGRSVPASPATGLDPSVLRSLPVVILKGEEGLECAVCLGEIVGQERARLLPKCNHGFHVHCIDMWFQSHSTCPICRNKVEQTTNHGNEMLVIDIPNPCAQEEDLKSPVMSTRLKRLLSKGKRALSPSTSTSTSTCVEPQHSS